MVVRRSIKGDFLEIVRMARALWPGVKVGELRREMTDRRFTFFVAEDGGKLVGFVMLNVRRDYVEGSTSSPVGYVEGIFVERTWRSKKVGAKLIRAAESWCLEKGFSELGSDVEAKNKASQKFHTRVGFLRGDLIVPFIKRIKKVRRKRRTL